MNKKLEHFCCLFQKIYVLIDSYGNDVIEYSYDLETINGLTGMGDLIVTCASRHSRNRKAGMLIGEGYTMQEAMDEVKMVVEGVYSAKAAIRLAQKYQVELPIIEQVNKILFEDKKAADALNDLMLRDPKTESDAGAWK